MKDYYSVLEIPPTLDCGEVKNAFKKLSKIYHPDVYGSSDMFKEINEAYSFLMNSEKKHYYDSLYFPHLLLPANQVIQLKLKITLKEAINGCKKLISFTMINGKQKTVSLNIPKRISNNTKLVFSKMGDTSNAGAPGDIIVITDIKCEDGWSVSGNNIITSTSIKLLDFLLGCDIMISTLDAEMEKVAVTVSPDTLPNSTVVVPKIGLKCPKTSMCGDLVIILKASQSKLSTKTLENIRNVVQNL